MLLQDWMATAMLAVEANTTVMRATRITKDSDISRLPVLSYGKLNGVIADHDLKDEMTDKCICLELDHTLEKDARGLSILTSFKEASRGFKTLRSESVSTRKQQDNSAVKLTGWEDTPLSSRARTSCTTCPPNDKQAS